MLTSRHEVIITRPLPGDPVERLRRSGIDAVWINPKDERLSPEQFRDVVAGNGGSVRAIITTPVDRVDGTLLDAAGAGGSSGGGGGAGGLVIVSNYAVGVDNIDLNECRRRGIIVGHTPDAVTEPTADIAWLLLLGAARRAWEGITLVHTANRPDGARWTGVAPLQLNGTRVLGKTLFIVGAGRIGLATARRALGWNMRLLYHARSRHPEFEQAPINAQRVTLEEGLQQADFVSLHTPLTSETRHLINAQRLRQMKPQGILINTARGPVVDEAALVEALRSGTIAAAGLDVYEHEPHVHPGLLELTNVFLLPHLGSATREDREWMTRLAVDNVIAALRREPVPHRVV